MSLDNLLGCAFFSACVTLGLMIAGVPFAIICLVTVVIGVSWPFMMGE